MDKQHSSSLEPLDLALSAKKDMPQALRPSGMMEAPAVAGSQPVRQRVHSAELFGTAREVVIEHAGEEYRLRLTRQGKLILTK
ncbi:MAG: hemin uptake protein HemP [Methylobacter sp.]|nr:hemin uptake protein HemP [Methylobacter sp.]